MPDNILAMSDEEFLQLNEPPKADATDGSEGGEGAQLSSEEQPAADTAAREAADAAAAEQTRKDEEAAAAEAAKDTSNSDTVTQEGEQANTGKQPNDVDPAAGQAAKDDTGKEIKDGAATVPGSEGATGGDPPDYEGFYKEIMKPIKANGKTISVKDPKEAIQLMQMGANYTRKMQALAPQRKLLMMLENNGMLDEAQLSFAIDLVKKRDPEAIKKLIKDAGVDPLGIDTNVEPTYREGNHRVSDEEAGFVDVLKDLQSDSAGKETIGVINQWDQASKDVLWKDPSVMQVIHEQRANGVYDRIATEVERLRTLGTIPANVPFLSAYRAIGEQLTKDGLLNDLLKPTPKPEEKSAVVKTPVTTTTAKPKTEVKNSAAARAASATPSTTKTASTKINPLSLSDEDFMKQVAIR